MRITAFRLDIGTQSNACLSLLGTQWLLKLFQNMRLKMPLDVLYLDLVIGIELRSLEVFNLSQYSKLSSLNPTTVNTIFFERKSGI